MFEVILIGFVTIKEINNNKQEGNKDNLPIQDDEMKKAKANTSIYDEYDELKTESKYGYNFDLLNYDFYEKEQQFR